MKGKLMKLISTVFLLLLASSAHSVTINILSEHLCPLDVLRWNPIRIDSCQSMESGEMRVSVSRVHPFMRFPIEMWTIVIDSSGYPVSCDEAVYDNRLILTSSSLGG